MLWDTVTRTPTGVLIPKTDLLALLQARHASPHAVLGMHPQTKGRSAGVVARALLREAGQCTVVDAAGGETWPMTLISPEGLFEAVIPKRPKVFRYQLRATYPGGQSRQFFDPYSFLPTLGEQDLYLFNEGNEHRIYEKLARTCE